MAMTWGQLKAVASAAVLPDTAQVLIELDLAAGTVTIDNDQSFSTGPADVEHLAGIDCEVEFSREFAGNPAGMKHGSEAIFSFKRGYIGDGTFSFASDINPSESEVVVAGPSASDGWGFVAWNEGYWGSDTSPQPVRVGIPKGVARFNALTAKFSNRMAYSGFELSGFSLVYNPMSVRVDR